MYGARICRICRKSCRVNWRSEGRGSCQIYGVGRSLPSLNPANWAFITWMNSRLKYSTLIYYYARCRTLTTWTKNRVYTWSIYANNRWPDRSSPTYSGSLSVSNLNMQWRSATRRSRRARWILWLFTSEKSNGSNNSNNSVLCLLSTGIAASKNTLLFSIVANYNGSR